MGAGQCEFVFSPPGSFGALIVSEVRFLRESLAEILAQASGIEVRGQSATLADALAAAEALRPAIVLLDAAFPGGMGAVARLSAVALRANVVVLAIAETEENVLAWAEAGIAGYVPNTASVSELVSLIGQISRGEQTCPSRIVGSLLRRIATSGRGVGPELSAAAALTRREFEILRLVGEGLSNKDIARRLRISLGTTKSHVHNLFGKLSVQGRAEATRLYAARHAELSPSIPVTSILSRSVDR
jgi:two-component system, NarL family, nitrate/nitrite response regulator NarL